MLFNSYIFILLFLPVTVAGWYLFNKLKHEWIAKFWLLGMSLWFYAYFNIKYFPIIVGSIIINYIFYKAFQRINKKSARHFLLALSLILNIGVLFYYKYLGFCISNVNALFNSDFNVIQLVLPLGISFFTFQQVSFVVDSYKGQVPEYSLLDYALFVAFFPQLIAGPIVLHDEIIPQFQRKENKKVNWDNIAKGITAFSFGLAKKVLIADTFGNAANMGFADIASLTSAEAIISSLAYTIQIYFDFSGYCDMAIGLGLLFNIKIPVNFNSPYRALDMDDFWKRWHITLTRFLRTNVYFPLGGSRKGTVRKYVNTLIVFLVSGIWHGANWTFVLWGMINGVAVVISKLLSNKTKIIKEKAPIIMWILTFSFISLAWIYFRADSISLANQMIERIFSFDSFDIRYSFFDVFQTSEFSLVAWVLSKLYAPFEEIYVHVFMWLFFAFAIVASTKFKNTSERIEQFNNSIFNNLFDVLIFFWSLISLSGVSTFLYFNF